jgi:hypothetical protein
MEVCCCSISSSILAGGHGTARRFRRAMVLVHPFPHPGSCRGRPAPRRSCRGVVRVVFERFTERPRRWVVKAAVLPINGGERWGAADTSKPRETKRCRSQALSRLRKGARPNGHDRGRASQFGPAVDKERKLISNLRWNMPMFVQIIPNIWPSGQHDKAID